MSPYVCTWVDKNPCALIVCARSTVGAHILTPGLCARCAHIRHNPHMPKTTTGTLESFALPYVSGSNDRILCMTLEENSC